MNHQDFWYGVDTFGRIAYSEEWWGLYERFTCSFRVPYEPFEIPKDLWDMIDAPNRRLREVLGIK